MWVSVDTSLSVHESLNHDEARLLVTVTTHDKLRLDDQDARFTERLVICEPMSSPIRWSTPYRGLEKDTFYERITNG